MWVGSVTFIISVIGLLKLIVSSSFWGALIRFIIYIRGMLVVYSYFCSISSGIKLSRVLLSGWFYVLLWWTLLLSLSHNSYKIVREWKQTYLDSIFSIILLPHFYLFMVVLLLLVILFLVELLFRIRHGSLRGFKK